MSIASLNLPEQENTGKAHQEREDRRRAVNIANNDPNTHAFKPWGGPYEQAQEQRRCAELSAYMQRF